MYIINTIPHGKCFVRYLRTRCFCIRNLTRSLRSLVRFLIQKQLVCKYRTPALSMKYSLYVDKNAVARNLFTENWMNVFCHFMFSTFHVFPLPPRKEIQLLSRFLCCVLFIWVLVEESVTTGVSSMAFFGVHAGFYSRVREKTRAFLTSLTSFEELHLTWVRVIAFVVSFNEHNYFNFLTLTRTINLRRCIYALGFKIHKLFKDREKFYWKLSCLASCKKRLYAGMFI